MQQQLKMSMPKSRVKETDVNKEKKTMNYTHLF